MPCGTLVKKVTGIAKYNQTLYVMGCFGSPLTRTNKARFVSCNSYNRKPQRMAMINKASEDTYGFDCVGLIKGVLWGWDGDKSRAYGGARYCTNNVPDIGANGMIAKCMDASAFGWDKMEPGEVVWLKDHIGVYIGNGLAVECTPKWKNGVQITAVANIGSKAGYNARRWSQHGHLPYVQYSGRVNTQPQTSPSQKPCTQGRKAEESARSFSKAVAGTYRVTASALNVRAGAGTDHKVMITIPRNAKVNCYGYYTQLGAVKWLYVQFKVSNAVYEGFCSEQYLRK